MLTISLAVAVSALISPADEIKTTLENYVSAVRTFDVPALEKLFNAEYVEVSPLGEVDDRARTLTFYAVPVEKRGPTPSSISISELSVRFPVKGIAVAIFREEVSIDAKGKPFKMAARVSSVLKHEKRGWTIVSNHFNGLRK